MRVITLGTFDIPHWGHFNLLNKCKEMADEVVIDLNTDEFITKYKGKPPVMTYKEREQSLNSLGIAGWIIPNDQVSGSAKEVILLSKANYIVIGSDWGRKDYLSQLGLDWDWLDENNIGIIYINYTKGVSTTELKKRLCK